MQNNASTKPVRLIFLLLSLVSINAQAAFNDSRVEKWEFYLAPKLTNSKVLQFDNGAEADINKRSSLAFGFGYNINAHIELSMEFASSSANYTSTVIPEDPAESPVKSTQSLYTSSLNLGFTYNLLSTPFTPFITATVGSTYIDSGIFTGNVGTGCWWYPYWGYVCGPVAQTYTSTEINYGAALGLRYDFNRKLYMKGDVGKNYIDFGNSNTPDFTTYRFTFGFMF
ncbi:MAG: porin family protein [Gammaproteobacteria bacterium]|nr:porin family protein [Gammaproteobacteria bacterium]MBT8134699.1 porin family protein [Gammaproteobacteria bacterium]NNJ50286.1 outer membrane beta-barrel protein [Gammaproteobacteria bacterium]